MKGPVCRYSKSQSETLLFKSGCFWLHSHFQKLVILGWRSVCRSACFRGSDSQHMPVTPVLGAEAGGGLSGLPGQLIPPISDLQVQRDPVSKRRSVIKVDTTYMHTHEHVHIHIHTHMNMYTYLPTNFVFYNPWLTVKPFWGWMRRSLVKSTCRSCRGPRFGS